MRKKLFNFLAAAMLCCSAMFMFSSCTVTEDKPVITPPSEAVQLKQGVWTEYDTALEASSEISGEQKTEDGLEYDVLSTDIDDDDLADIPAVGMKIEGSKAYFFTYSAEGADDLVEGKISYDKDSKKGTIAFPAITGSPISGQTVSFKMVSDELMQFEFTYEGKKATGSCAWLCENTDNWGEPTTNEEWEELMAYYSLIGEDWGPDPSIDWGDLAEPLTWDETPQAKANKRAVGAILEGVSAGLDMFASIFGPDPMEEINAKLDAVLGKLDNVLQNQQKIMAQLDQVNARLIAIAEKMNQQETLNKFNERNKDFYNKLEAQNNAYFNSAFKLYDANKNNLSADQRAKLGDYGKEWVGSNREFINLTWEYIKYLTTVQHSTYGVGMDKIYDGLTFAKYPWEHMGINDRKNYRAYDIAMIAKSLFMIGLYAQYGGLSDVAKEGIYNNYDSYRKQLKEFCMFNVSNPDKFLVCQIPGAHFIMHKELQKYKFSGANNKAPHPDYCGGRDAVYRPEWHEAGSVKVENPAELKSKLFSFDEIYAIQGYYKSAVYPNQNKISWKNMLVDGNKIAGGAVFAKQPTTANDFRLRLLLNDGTNYTGVHILQNGSVLGIIPSVGDIWLRDLVIHGILHMGRISGQYWSNYDSGLEYYAAIVEKRY